MKLHSLTCSVFAVCLVSLFAGSATAQDVEYELKFEGRWNSSLPRPGGAHFTQIVGATHNSAGSLLAIGSEASLGVENVAETGSVGALVSEINAGIVAGTADSLILGTDSFISPEETNTFNFFANIDHSQLTFITMIAPTPDWFNGVHDLELRENGVWRQQIVLDLVSYDAGSENGSGFSLSNSPTNPRGVIANLDTAEPTGVLFGAGPLARLTLTRISAVPEPSSMLVLAGTMLAIASRRRR